MDRSLLLRFFTNPIICVSLVIAVPQVVRWLFPVFWGEDYMGLTFGFKLVYVFVSWGFLGWRDVLQYHPEDQVLRANSETPRFGSSSMR